MTTQNAIGGHLPKDWDRRGLPAWTYHSPAMLELEKQELFRSHWQLAGHVNDVPKPGDFFTFDIANERAIIMRGDDGEVRAFHNLCRHRGSRVAAEKSGHCKNALVCPFHGWVYNLDGTLRGAARPQSFGALDKTEFGLKPIELEIWMGFIFIRFLTGPQGSVAETMSRLCSGTRRLPARRHRAHGIASRKWSLPVNWKSVRDVDNEGYHVAMAHPALQDLYGSTYYDLPYLNGVSRSHRPLQPPCGTLLERAELCRDRRQQHWLPEDKRDVWGYYGLFPNLVIAVTPEIRPVLSGVPARRGQDPHSRRGLSQARGEPRAAARALSRLAHRPGHLQGRYPALHLVERVDEIIGLRQFSPVRSRARRPQPPRPHPRRSSRRRTSWSARRKIASQRSTTRCGKADGPALGRGLTAACLPQQPASKAAT